jgi:hypothetical protein
VVEDTGAGAGVLPGAASPVSEPSSQASEPSAPATASPEAASA